MRKTNVSNLDLGLKIENKKQFLFSKVGLTFFLGFYQNMHKGKNFRMVKLIIGKKMFEIQKT